MTAKFLSRLFAYLIICSANATAIAQTSNLSQLAEKTSPAVVHITLYDNTNSMIGTASGFFVRSDGLVITNEHVVSQAASMAVTLSDGSKRPVEGVMASAAEKDLAIVKVSGGQYPALLLSDSKQITKGSTVIVIGSPLGLSGSLSTGILSAKRKRGFSIKASPRKLNVPLLQITAAISQGSSGSPVLSTDGSVIGIAMAIYEGGQNVNFAVPAEEAQALLQSIPHNKKPEPLANSRWHNLVISLIVFSAFAAMIWLIRKLVQRHR